MLKIEKSQGGSQFGSLMAGKVLSDFSLQKEGAKGLDQAIFATIAYYDYFNYPLTAPEIYYYLINSKVESEKTKAPSVLSGAGKSSSQNAKIIFTEILEALDANQSLKKFIGQKNGFYFLRGREEIIKKRIQKKKLADEKFKKIKWIFKVIYYLPFIRLVALSGSMGLGNPYKESDIDLLVVAKAGRIWTARAILTFFAMILGKYRHIGKTRDCLCLNHYITDQSLFINFGNLYKAEEYLNLVPLAGEIKIYEDFFSANREWLEKHACLVPEMGAKRNLLFSKPSRIPAKAKYFAELLFSGFFGEKLEKLMENFQTSFIKKNPLTGKNVREKNRSRVLYNDDNLVFHPVLVEPEVIGKWEEKMSGFQKSNSLI